VAAGKKEQIFMVVYLIEEKPSCPQKNRSCTLKKKDLSELSKAYLL